MGIDLASLSPDEKLELHAKLSYEFRGGKSHVFSRSELALWAAIVALLPRYELTTVESFVEKFGSVNYEFASGQLESLMAAAVPADLRRHARTAVRCLIIDCLLDYLKSRGIPVNGPTLLRSFEHLEYAVDRKYPGYIKAGLIHKVVTALAT